MFSLNTSGQGFSVFRLLISAIMGLMILLIILGVVKYFESLRANLGLLEIFKAFTVATNKPDGTVIKRENIELPADSIISAFSLSQDSGISKDCIQITGSVTSPISYAPDLDSAGNSATIEKNLTLTVYLQCKTKALGCENDACETCCKISLNKMLESE